MDILNNNATFLEQRNKINNNFQLLDEGKVDAQLNYSLVSEAEKQTWNDKANTGSIGLTFKGAVTLSTPTPTEAGIYQPTQEGAYANFGGLIFNALDGQTLFSFGGGSNFGKQVTPSVAQGLYKNTTKESYIVENVPKTVTTSMFGLTLDTNMYDFEVGDVVTFTAKITSLTIDLPSFKIGYALCSGGRLGNGAIDKIITDLIKDVPKVIAFNHTITAPNKVLINEFAELAMSFLTQSLPNLSNWQLKVEDLTLTNTTKGFTINQVTNLNWNLVFAGNVPKLISGKFFKPTTISYPNITKPDHRKMKGLRIFASGDSNTEELGGNSYMNQVQRVTGASVTNVAIAGTSMSALVKTITGFTYPVTSGVQRIINVLDMDVLTIMIGTNGGSYELMDGAYTTNTVWDLPKTIGGVNYTPDNLQPFFEDLFNSTGKFLDGFQTVIQYVLFLNPKCKIYLISTPLKYSLPNEQENRRNQLKSLANYYNIEYIDALSTFQTILKNIPDNYPTAKGYSNMIDTVHLSKEGYRKWGNYVAHVMNRDMY